MSQLPLASRGYHAYRYRLMQIHSLTTRLGGQENILSFEDAPAAVARDFGPRAVVLLQPIAYNIHFYASLANVSRIGHVVKVTWQIVGS